jgi:uncharacterized protein (TIGR03435 family)
MVPIVRPSANGRLTATNVPLRVLVRFAYGVQDFQIEGGPSWQMSSRFDISAKAPEGSAQAILPMMKTLLTDRFKLKMHTETKEMPVYALVVARSDQKLGPDLKPSTSDCSNAQEAQKRAEALQKGGTAELLAMMKSGQTIPCAMMPSMAGGPQAGFGIKANGQPMAPLVQLLMQATGKIVQDKTGLTGLYDWELRFDPEVFLRVATQFGVNLPPGAAANLPPSDSPALLTALQEQLGLKLDSQRAPVEVLVIDSAELPEPD